MELLINETPLIYNEETKRYFNMTAAVKTKVYDEVTGSLKVTYSNYTEIRPCKVEDFAKPGMQDDFYERTKIKNNFYCPEGYENVTLAI
jgi:hypothetical protein